MWIVKIVLAKLFLDYFRRNSEEIALYLKPIDMKSKSMLQNVSHIKIK